MAKKTVAEIAPFPFRYGQYRDKAWWVKVKKYAIDHEISINELLVTLLDEKLADQGRSS